MIKGTLQTNQRPGEYLFDSLTITHERMPFQVPIGGKFSRAAVSLPLNREKRIISRQLQLTPTNLPLPQMFWGRDAKAGVRPYLDHLRRHDTTKVSTGDFSGEAIAYFLRDSSNFSPAAVMVQPLLPLPKSMHSN